MRKILGGRTFSRIKIPMLILEVEHFQESKLVHFLEVSHFLEIRGRTFSIVSHKHGHPSKFAIFLEEENPNRLFFCFSFRATLDSKLLIQSCPK